MTGGRRQWRGRGWRIRRRKIRLGRYGSLIGSPLSGDLSALFGRKTLELLIALACGTALFGGQLRPVDHALFQALARRRLHLGITLCDGHPFLAALRVQLVPLAGERGEDLLLFGRELGPRGSCVLATLGLVLRGDDRKCETEPGDQRDARFSHESKPLSR